ncbi:50S ribosomal protein L4 [Nanoarchaeota archaeon]
MQVPKLTIENQEQGKVELPSQFNEPVRDDIIKRAVLAIRSHKRQSHGADPEAGKKVSSDIPKRRRKYRTSYGYGISRTPRKILSRRGTRMYWVGAFAPNTVGGRRAHPPKTSKLLKMKVNKKERRKAIRSAMSASVIKDIVSQKGHKVPDNYPFIIEDKIQSLSKTKEVISTLEKFGLKEELIRSSKTKIRAGRGKARGRKYQNKIGPLIVVGDDCALLNSGANIPGVDVVLVQKINTDLLAPGAEPGRLTLWTESAISKLSQEKLFTESYKAPSATEKKQEEKSVKK